MLIRGCVFFVWLTTSGCASYHGFNYLDPRLPRCAESFRPLDDTLSEPGTFKFVSFNIKFGEEPDKAVRTLARNDLDDADVLVLQEMDLPSTRQIARELRVDYVYYPIAVHPQSGRQFGLAILSPWPIREDRKILLPRIESSDDISKMALFTRTRTQRAGAPMANQLVAAPDRPRRKPLPWRPARVGTQPRYDCCVNALGSQTART